jgi:hypothetical protein
MKKTPRPKVNMFPDEDKEWGGYRDAVQCIHCRRWMVIDFEKNYLHNGKNQYIIIFKELYWDGWNWYISRRQHNPSICGTMKQFNKDAKADGYKSWNHQRRGLGI